MAFWHICNIYYFYDVLLDGANTSKSSVPMYDDHNHPTINACRDTTHFNNKHFDRTTFIYGHNSFHGRGGLSGSASASRAVDQAIKPGHNNLMYLW